MLLTLVGGSSAVTTPLLAHFFVAASVVAASLLFGAASISRSPIERLSELRMKGVFLRNYIVRTPTDFELWSERFGSGEKKSSTLRARRLEGWLTDCKF